MFRRSPRKRKEALLLRPNDHRGEELIINRETDAGLQCNKHEGMIYRIMKHGPAWSFPNTDRFLCIEGEPMTTFVTEEDEKVEAPILEFLELAWTKDALNRLPDSLKDPLMGINGHKWAATVTVAPGEIDPEIRESLDKLKAQAILKEHNISMFEDFAKAEPKKDRLRTLMEQAMPILLGFFLGIASQIKGWI